MKVGDTIKWTAEGKTVTGQVLAMDDKRVKFQTKTEVLDVLLDDGKFEVIDGTVAVEPSPAPQRKARSAKTKRPPAAGTKTEAAMAIYKAMPNGTRQEIIKAFIDRIGLSPAGAATYYTNCKNASKGKP